MLLYDIPEEFASYQKARFIVVPVPFEQTTTYGKGTKNGPDAIFKASSQVELYDEELGTENFRAGIHMVNDVVAELALLDSAKQDLLDSAKQALRLPEMLGRVIARVLGDKKIPIILGGEHSISAPAVSACKKAYKNLSILQFDAHADLRDQYEGSPLSHACVMRRIYDIGVPFVQVGIRNHSTEEAEFIKEKKLRRPFYAHEICSLEGSLRGRRPWQSPATHWIDNAINCLSDDVYLTFDVDVFDPSVIPSTGTPEPGGLNWYQVTTFLKKLAAKKNIVAADFVELAPREGERSSDFTIAKLIYRTIGYISLY